MRRMLLELDELLLDSAQGPSDGPPEATREPLLGADRAAESLLQAAEHALEAVELDRGALPARAAVGASAPAASAMTYKAITEGRYRAVPDLFP